MRYSPSALRVMPDVIDDLALNVFAIVSEPKEAAAKIMERFGDIAGTVSCYNPNAIDPHYWLPVVEELRNLQAAAAA
jgi:hypothetical protein